MKRDQPYALPPLLTFGAVTLALAAIAGLGFALWSQNGARMFMALVESGLAWCF